MPKLSPRLALIREKKPPKPLPSGKFGRLRHSVQLQFVVVFVALEIFLIVLLNTYPLLVTRDLVFSSKQSALINQASVVASSFGGMDTLTETEAKSVMTLLNIMPLSRVLITDSGAKILYDTSLTDPRIGGYALLPEISQALSGYVTFYCAYSGGAFSSRACMPIVSKGETLGAVYLFEYDEAQAALLTDIQSTLLTVSAAIGLVSTFLVLAFTRTLTRRIRELVRAIRIVREGEYDYRIGLRGRDEIAELSDEFNVLTRRLQETEEIRRRFVSDASHELKTPLAAIRLLSDSIGQSAGMDTITMREFAADIGSEAERLQRITEKLLSLTRLDSSVETKREYVNLRAVAETVLHMLSPLAEKEGISLRQNLADGCEIFASYDDIYQIIFNLVENGIKYNLPGGSVTLTLTRGGDTINLYADDTGIGIPAEDLPQIFSRFYRVDKARSREAGGSGLGLSIVRDAVLLHGGTITAEPREGGGTRFALEFEDSSP